MSPTVIDESLPATALLPHSDFSRGNPGLYVIMMIITEYLVISKQDLVKDKLFHLVEPFQLINSRDQI